MELSYIPPMLSKDTAMRLYEAQSFVNKGTPSQSLIFNTYVELRKLPEEAFSESFEKFGAANAGELMAKFNMRSYAYVYTINETIDETTETEQAVMRAGYTQFAEFLQFAGKTLAEGQIVFPCVIDIPNDSIFNNRTLE